MKIKMNIADKILTDLINASMQWSWWAGSDCANGVHDVLETDEDSEDGFNVIRLDWSKGFELAVTSHAYALSALDSMCASKADVLVQLAAFGEVKYG